MDPEEDLGGAFLISVDDLGVTGLWNSVKPVRVCSDERYRLFLCGCIPEPRRVCIHLQIFLSRLPLQRLSLQNKLGKGVLVDRLNAQCVGWCWRMLAVRGARFETRHI